jgi:hypothetical protein
MGRTVSEILTGDEIRAAVNLHTGRGAALSGDGRYRYLLTRGTYDRAKRSLLWMMLNPSDADHERDDATIRRCNGFCLHWQIPYYEVGNLYGLRSPYPRALWAAADPVGPDNDRYLLAAAARADIIVLAWGSHGKRAKQRADDVMALLWKFNARFHVLGWSKGGDPRHPLMMPSHASLLPASKA